MTRPVVDDCFDGALAAMLDARAARIGAPDVDLATIAAVTQQCPSRWQTPRAVAGGFVALAATLVFIVGATLLGPLRELSVASRAPADSPPATSTSPSPRASSRGSASPSAVEGTWPGGIPRSIDGEPVLVGLEAQARIAAVTDDRSFLIGSPWHTGPLICSHPIVKDPDPNPLAVVGCPPYAFEGVPRAVLLPQGVVDGPGGPVVLRVHRNDPGAATCRTPELCRRVLVVESVVWRADRAGGPTPIDVPDAVGSVLAVTFADVRHPDPNVDLFVDLDTFALPIACPAPAPSLAYALRGDPRLGLLFVFADAAERQAYEASTEPALAAACLDDPFVRPERPQWIARDNTLILVFGDGATVGAIRDLVGKTPTDNTMRVPLPLPDVDLAVEVIDEYLDARAAGESGHAVGERLILDQSDEWLDAYAGWDLDSLRRLDANALAGTITLVDADATRAEAGDRAWAARGRRGSVSIYRVDYAGATDPALASETFAVVDDPNGELSPWLLFRIGGAPYPEVAQPVEVINPVPGLGGGGKTPAASSDDGSGDVPCGPTPCGEERPSPLP